MSQADRAKCIEMAERALKLIEQAGTPELRGFLLEVADDYEKRARERSRWVTVGRLDR